MTSGTLKRPNLTWRIQRIAKLYRNLQIFHILTNGYIQSYILTTVQFNGSAVSVYLLFSIIAFWKSLDGTLLLFIFVTFFGLQVLILLYLEFASKPFLISRKILGASIQTNFGNDAYAKRFFRSCQPVALRIGPFHKVDKDRAPATIRFILQRTVFMVKAINCQ